MELLAFVFGLATICVVYAEEVSDHSAIVPPIASGLKQGICTEGYFQCENHKICVQQQKNCDGKPDCPDSSDELICEDQNDDAYWDNRFVKNPAAIHDDLNGKNCSLQYSGACICKGAGLFCRYKNYQSAPDDLPRGNVTITLLDFTGNNFTALTESSFRSVSDQVEKIILNHCDIREVHEQAFYNLSRLKKLHLSNNYLKNFPPEVFPEESDLEELSLTFNSIAEIHPEAFRNLSNLKELDLRGNSLTTIDGRFLEPLVNLKILILQSNKIKRIEPSSFPKMALTTLSVTENQIESLENGSFSNLKQLLYLYLSNNKLRKLSNEVFYNLNVLKALTLDDNSIAILEVRVFRDVPNLETLNLERNKFRSLDPEVMKPLRKLESLYFSRFELCSSALHVRKCYPQGDGISDQGHMLANPVLRMCVWLMGAIGCIGNVVVLLGRHFAPTTNVVHSLYLRNLAMSDLLMGVYLFIIATEDQIYSGVYLVYQYVWRHSYVCLLCGFLSTLSCESSVFILTLVTWDRFVSVTQPLARKQPSKKTAAATLLLFWCMAVIVAILPISSFAEQYFGDEFYGNNGVCLSLHIHEPYAKGWQYSAVMFICFNTIALIFICYAYLRMINEIRASGVACRSTRQSQDRDKVAQRFGIIVLTDCLCWVPVILVKLVALSGLAIHQDLYAWLAIFILPINSALNPVLYTLTTTVFKKQMRKMINSCRSKKSEHQHSASESGFSLSLGVFPIGNTKRIFSYRGTHSSSLTGSKNSWRRSTPV